MKKHFRFLGMSISFSLFSLCLLAQSDVSWTNGRFAVEVHGKEITVLHDAKKLLNISSVNFNFEAPLSVSTVKQTSDSLILRLKYPPFAKYGNEKGSLKAELSISVVNNSLRFKANPKWAHNTTIQIQDDDAHYFGIVEELYPNNSKSPDLRGNVVDVDAIGNDNQYHENYASVWSAFYMTNKGYASFYDTYAKGKYTLGINGKTELYHETGKLDWYIIPGSNGDEILKAYYGIIGKPKFIPLWACGPVGWRDENKGGSDEILNDIKQMTDLHIPFTSWMVDRPYCNGANEWSKMDFNSKFANPKEWIGKINHDYGMQFMTWVGPLTFGDTSFPALLPNYKAYMDLSNPEAVKEFGNRLAINQYTVNVRGHKMDRAEEDFPEQSPWYDKTPEPERRGKYLFLYSKVIDSFLRAAYGADQFNYARGAYHRCQPVLSAIWGGDSRSTWDGMASNVANAIRAGYMGFPVWGTDVGGYLGGKISDKLYARWLQFGSWSGLYEIKLDDAGGKGADRVPWKYSKQLQDIFRNCSEHRMQMLPYIYSLVNTSYNNGVLMKPLAYSYPNDANTYGIWDEYLLGNAFLVAPITDSTDARKVYLPEGEWYDYNDQTLTAKYNGGQTIDVTAAIDKIPVFIKANSIWVEGNMKEPVTKDKNAGNFIISYLCPSANAKTSFDYVDYFDNNTEKTIEALYNSGHLTIQVPAIMHNTMFRLKLNKEVKSLMVNNKKSKANGNLIWVKMKPGISYRIDVEE